MKDKVEFLICFPCYTPMKSEVDPHTFNCNGRDCVMLATDDDILNQAYETVLGKPSLRVRQTFKTPEDLLAWIQDIANRPVRGRSIEFVIVDPTPTDFNMVGRIQELISGLESQLR